MGAHQPRPPRSSKANPVPSVFFNQRVSKKREAEMAKRNRERLSQPGLFPSVPKNLPGS
ncbi:hypothetical protein IMZ48_45415 [Candidatus Bathyarchaeota archaeon]|nr:hypothetical protein [Candidatus Bathyarchaeota archaeon]